MEARKITVISTKTQSKKVIMSSATTLAELKKDFDTNGIDYTDMSFFEGVSKVEIKSDESILPHDVPYKGTITNELVFMLTNTNKKIKSSMIDRKEAYNKIKENNLQANCKDIYGKSYTNCSTLELEDLLERYNVTTTTTTLPSTPEVIEVDNVEEDHTVFEVSNTNDTNIKKVVKALITLVSRLADYSYIERKDEEECLKEIKGILSSKDCTIPYTEEELEDMFDFVEE